jgi:hypothetical protein
VNSYNMPVVRTKKAHLTPGTKKVIVYTDIPVRVTLKKSNTHDVSMHQELQAGLHISCLCCVEYAEHEEKDMQFHATGDDIMMLELGFSTQPQLAEKYGDINAEYLKFFYICKIGDCRLQRLGEVETEQGQTLTYMGEHLFSTVSDQQVSLMFYLCGRPVDRFTSAACSYVHQMLSGNHYNKPPWEIFFLHSSLRWPTRQELFDRQTFLRNMRTDELVTTLRAYLNM